MASQITDEQLSCYMDGELSSNEMVSVEKAIEKDKELQMRLEKLSQADDLWKEAVLAQHDSELPPAILGMLQEDKSLPANDNLKFWRLPIAASLAFALGLTIQPLLNTNAGNFDATLLAGEIGHGSSVYTFLENIPSAESVKLKHGNELTAKPVLTFATNDGRFCREFIISTKSSATRNVACRGNRKWEVMIASRTRLMADNHYQTVSAETDQAVDLLIDSIIKGIPLDKTAEQALLDSSWKKNK